MMTNDMSALVIGKIIIPSTKRAAGIAREYVTEILDPGLPSLSDLVLCVSELVTNAVVHTKSRHVTVQLTEIEKELRLDVTDEGGAESVPHVSDAFLGEGGRGLLIVNGLVTAWGVRGTTVWCTVPR
jgi:anti-sigma regulatory factor (Ser/Thr protein kinase)